MNINLFLFSLILFQSPVTNPTVDSLNQALQSSSGTEKVIILNDLYKQYANNDPVKAMDYTQQALDLATEINDPSGMASSYNNIGVLNKNRGKLDEALDSYLNAVRIEEEYKFVDALPYTYNNIGTIYSLKGEFEKALVYFNKALEQFQSINHKLRIIGTLNNIGNVYSDLQEYDYALKNYLQSLEIYESLEDNSEAFVPFNNIGNIYFQRGEWANAMAFYESAFDLERLNNDKNGQANALHNIGTVHKATKNYEKAIEVFNEALSTAQETDNKRLIEIIYGSLAETYFASGDMFMAYSFLQLHNNTKEQVFNELSNRRIAELESAFEFEKKEAEIEALKIQSELQQLQIQNDKIVITSVVIVSFLVVGLSLVIWQELRTIRKNKKQLEAQNIELENQKLIIQEKNDSITESIDYAKSVQGSMLKFTVPDKYQDDFFVLFRPKDIVSGDFFWFSHNGNNQIVAAADCTGHGVAGAFMTVIGHSSLDQIINKENISEPDAILEKLDLQVQKSINQSDRLISDHGMDVALCSIDRGNKKLVFAGANRPLYFVRSGELHTIKGTKHTIGDNSDGKVSFEKHEVTYEAGDVFYLFSDGYPDQFGGKENKKFMVSNFKQMLIDIHTLPLVDQKKKLDQTLSEWKGKTEQTDDILVMGFKV
ncbi:tetratricopeptide repeat protein [Fulvivirga lutea]|uniref:Tetratricopeptide repeat protein n=1 Tax=Fulvivirga lutea TaxID=2810512 RepID=A0A974WEQ1_9BACT|nr:tetratricopeptide repeat protein [Fulvivirga lutea]QSE96274.1 tetratricopeptide repeat protein [Fulvivirga lutea]